MSVVSRAALMVAQTADLKARTMGGTKVGLTVALWVDYLADESDAMTVATMAATSVDSSADWLAVGWAAT